MPRVSVSPLWRVPLAFGAMLAASASAPRRAAAQPAAAASAPSRFAGAWVLDTARSTKGPGMPAAMTMHVRTDGAKLVVRRVAEGPMGTADVSFTYALDGSASVNKTQQAGAEVVVTTTAKPDEAALVLDSQIQTPAQAVHQVDRWALAPDGAELTVARQVRVAEQQMSMTFVFRKKAGA